MEQSSPYNYSQGIKHASVASSVYSPIQTEFVPESNAIMEEDEDEDEAEQQQEQPPQRTQENSVDEIEEVSATSDESDGQSDDETVSHDGVNNDNDDDDDDRNGLIADKSTQTIQTFMTANTRLHAENIPQTNATGSRSSLTSSTNESSNNSATQLLDPLDTDATPVLTNAATNIDKTPIVSPDGFVQTGIEQTTASLPQRKLSKSSRDFQ